MGLRGKLDRLKRAVSKEVEPQLEALGREAVRRLSDRELKVLHDALKREEHLPDEEFPQLPVSEEEQRAIDAYNTYYEEVRRRGA